MSLYFNGSDFADCGCSFYIFGKFPPSFTFNNVLQNWYFKSDCMVTER